ncbi:MAG: hypothetical protein AAB515_01665 [Patescibacteria group bacterium]
MNAMTYTPIGWQTNRNGVTILVSLEIPETAAESLVGMCDTTAQDSQTLAIVSYAKGKVAIIPMRDAQGHRQIQIRPYVAGTVYTA